MKLFKPEISQNCHANYDLFILKREYHNTTSWLHYWFSIIFFYWMKTWDWPFKIWWLINFLGRRIGKGIFLDFGFKKKLKKKAFELWRGSLVCFFIEIHQSQLGNSFKHLLEFFLIKEKNILFCLITVLWTKPDQSLSTVNKLILIFSFIYLINYLHIVSIFLSNHMVFCCLKASFSLAFKGQAGCPLNVW